MFFIFHSLAAKAGVHGVRVLSGFLFKVLCGLIHYTLKWRPLAEPWNVAFRWQIFVISLLIFNTPAVIQINELYLFFFSGYAW